MKKSLFLSLFSCCFFTNPEYHVFPYENVVSNRNCGKPGACPALMKNSGDFLLARGDGLLI